jgi:Tol biopolymer transport system component
MAALLLLSSGCTFVRVSVRSDGSEGNGASRRPAVSSDGTVIAFASNSSLAGGCGDQFDLRMALFRTSVYVHDRTTATTTCVSAFPDGSPAGGDNPSLSADGRFVAFHTSDDLVPGCGGAKADVFVVQRATGSVACVSVASNGGTTNGNSLTPALSANGRFVAFLSVATNLVPGCGGTDFIFVKDRETGIVTCDSVATGGTIPDGFSQNPALSADGRFVAFDSTATNFVPGCGGVTQSVFVRDRELGVTTCVSVASDGTPGTGREPKLSASGQVVAFESSDPGLVPGCATAGRGGIFVHDRVTGATTCASVTDGGAPAVLDSFDPAISGDGRLVAFHSAAGNLDPACPPEELFRHVFVHDRVMRATRCISDPANRDSRNAALSASGLVVAFESEATNLVPDDTNDVVDILVAVLTVGSSSGFAGGVFVAGGNVLPGGLDEVVTAAGGGGGPHVRVFRTTVPTTADFFAYAPDFTGGVRIAACDFDGDGRAEIVTAAGPGGGPHVRVIKLDASGNPTANLASFFAYDRAFTGGVFVACGDVNGDGRPDVVTAADAGGGPHVRAFSGATLPTPTELASFFAFDPAFTGGVRVAACDFDGDGRAEILTAAGPGGGPHVRVVKLDAGGNPAADVASFFAFDPAFTGGVFVACGDLQLDGRPDIVAGADAGGGPHVRAFSGATLPALSELVNIFAYDPAFTGGVRVAVGTVTGVGPAIVTAPGPGGGPHVRVFGSTGVEAPFSFFAY